MIVLFRKDGNQCLLIINFTLEIFFIFEFHFTSKFTVSMFTYKYGIGWKHIVIDAIIGSRYVCNAIKDKNNRMQKL